MALLARHQGRPGHTDRPGMGGRHPRLSDAHEHHRRRRRSGRHMARGPPRTVRQRQRPRAHHGAARRRRRVDKPVPRPDQRAEIMQADGEDAPRTGRARTLRHRHARQLAVRAMASMGRMEGAKRVRRRRGMGCVGRQREKPARHGGRRLNDAAPACRPDRGGVRQGIAQRGRVHTPRAQGRLLHRPQAAQGNRQNLVHRPRPGGRLQDHVAQHGRVDGTVQRLRARRRHAIETTARRLGGRCQKPRPGRAGMARRDGEPPALPR
ncbi:hypothetical protein DXC85_05355 [Bifidobacterium longum]|uniref:LigA n=1 Tax=Bifidobacterium longum TaxID=216816 RepID=A0AB37LGL2_BIFLN|nr:hypothetical protein DXC85_05355 [Bifidobacterium longum]